MAQGKGSKVGGFSLRRERYTSKERIKIQLMHFVRFVLSDPHYNIYQGVFYLPARANSNLQMQVRRWFFFVRNITSHPGVDKDYWLEFI